jgi:hypothetical protein
MSPAPTSEQTPDVTATLQGRGAHHLRPTFSLSLAANAPGQATQLARVDRQVGLANAAALVALGARVPISGMQQACHRTQSTG